MGNEERWFVRADKDAPLKGPYTREKIEQSYSKGLLKPGSLLEPEVGESKYKTVKTSRRSVRSSKSRSARR